MPTKIKVSGHVNSEHRTTVPYEINTYTMTYLLYIYRPQRKMLVNLIPSSQNKLQSTRLMTVY